VGAVFAARLCATPFTSREVTASTPPIASAAPDNAVGTAQQFQLGRSSPRQQIAKVDSRRPMAMQ
jgi:hypothetical protein